MQSWTNPSTVEEERWATLDRLAQIIDVSPSGAVVLKGSLHLADADGNVFCEISNDLDGGSLTVKSKRGNTNVSLGCTPDGGFVDIHHADGSRLAVTLSTNAEGVPSIEFYDSSGNGVPVETENVGRKGA